MKWKAQVKFLISNLTASESSQLHLPVIVLMAMLVFWPANVLAKEESPREPVQSDPVLDIYVREGCPHCRDAKDFMPDFLAQYPSVRVRFFDVAQDKTAADQLVALYRSAGQWPPSVPTFLYKNRMLIGFKNATETGADLVQMLGLQVGKDGPANARAIDTSWFGQIDVETLGLPLFTLAIGLLDGFNPCAMWVLLFLLSMLVHLKSRTRMALIAGSFVVVSGFVYYAFMAAWLNMFLLVGLSKSIQYALAVLAITIALINIKDYVRPAQGISLSIPQSAKPGIYARMRAIIQADNIVAAVLAATLLAVIVNVIELLCTAGFPAMYTAILTHMSLSSAEYYGYLGLYILAYMADDTLMVAIAVIALSSKKLSVNAGRYLKLLSGLVMLVLGLVMLGKPEWLF